ncbi:MAG: excinuclease ABC subunit UvrC [Firmicutes bacterium]|nr:excinuclease ABC subunit UvrC [Bacillota bacterium]
MDMKEKIAKAPVLSGVYIFKDDLGRIIYIGKANNLRNRLRSYFQNPPRDFSHKTTKLRKTIADLDYIVVNSQLEALILEANLIKKHRPYFNIRMKDDKRYPLIELTTYEAYPRMRIVRKAENKKSRYFGPYTNTRSMRQAFKLVQKLFKIRTCKYDLDKPLPRPCLDYHIGLCPAPCTRYETIEEYTGRVKKASQLLDGRCRDVISLLKKELETYAENLEFEKCIPIREALVSLEHVCDKQQVVTKAGEDMDFIGIHREDEIAAIALLEVRDGIILNQQRYMMDIPMEENSSVIINNFILQHYKEGFFIPHNIYLPSEIEHVEELETWISSMRGRPVEMRIPERGEKKNLLDMANANAFEYLQMFTTLDRRNLEKHKQELEHLRDLLGLADVPHRIEGYDISNIGGKMATASMVVFQNGEPHKDHYRRFRIETKDEPDDFAMMREALTRRFRNLKLGELESFRETPDLILIDGGKGQLSSAVTAAESEEADNLNIISIAKKEEEIYLPGRSEPLETSPDSPGLNLLRRVRDEAHRFAVSYHRKLRAKKMEISVLDSIPGIAKGRKETLLQSFDSIEDIKNASLFELEQLPGFNRQVAERVLRYLGSSEKE